jgi:hypothetical protein
MGFIGSIGKTIKEVQELVKLNLVSCYFSLLFRETVNKAAHALAALECECAEGVNPILDPLPNCIQLIVAAESAVHA